METLADFALTCYRRPNVADCCLHLQDNAGADVNMLLTAAWLSEQGRIWSHEQVRILIASCAEWRDRCILPLREIRRFLKRDEVGAMYRQAKALELEAEIHQLQLLQAKLAAMSLRADAIMDALDSNLRNYFSCSGDGRAIADEDYRALCNAMAIAYRDRK